MNMIFFTGGIISIIKDPSGTWQSILSDRGSIKTLCLKILFPLVAFVAIAAFSGAYLFTYTGFSKAYGIFSGLKCLILYPLVITGTAFISVQVSKYIDRQVSFEITFRLVAWSAIPLLLCQIFNRLFESLFFVNVLALYGFYILWTGIETAVETDKRKRMIFFLATSVTFIVLLVISDKLLTTAANSLYYALYSLE